MFIARPFLAVYLFFILTILSDVYPIWSAEHLDDLIVSDAYQYSVPALTPAFIALHETECTNRLFGPLQYTDSGLPQPTQLLITHFDRNKARTVPWYDWDQPKWDLFLRYNISTDAPSSQWCPTILYQPAQWDQPVVQYNPNKDGTFVNWAWNMLQINVTFTNNLEQPVSLSLATQQNANDIPDLINEIYVAVIEPSQSETVLLQVSDVIVVWNANHEVLNRFRIHAADDTININQISTDKSILDEDKFVQKFKDDVKFRKQRIWMTRRRHLFNVLVPPKVQHFTPLGFDHRKMPQEICEYLTDFYQRGKNSMRVESFPRDNPLINAHEIPMKMLHIPGDKKIWIADVIRPLLEEWSGQQLKYSILYGLRQYSKGAVLKGHCDRIETHVVSTILHLRHDPLDVPWPIEVYGFDKKRHYLEDAPCTMTFYESASLIHGRPSTYNGSEWVNAFLHFRPLKWRYRFTRENKVVTPYETFDLYDPQKYG